MENKSHYLRFTSEEQKLHFRLHAARKAGFDWARNFGNKLSSEGLTTEETNIAWELLRQEGY